PHSRGTPLGARRISKAPRTAAAAGQTIASPGHGPDARTNSTPLATSRPAPSAILAPPRDAFAGLAIAADDLSRGLGWRGRRRAGSRRAPRARRARGK